MVKQSISNWRHSTVTVHLPQSASEERQPTVEDHLSKGQRRVAAGKFISLFSILYYWRGKAQSKPSTAWNAVSLFLCPSTTIHWLTGSWMNGWLVRLALLSYALVQQKVLWNAANLDDLYKGRVGELSYCKNLHKRGEVKGKYNTGINKIYCTPTFPPSSSGIEVSSGQFPSWPYIWSSRYHRLLPALPLPFYFFPRLRDHPPELFLDCSAGVVAKVEEKENPEVEWRGKSSLWQWRYKKCRVSRGGEESNANWP